MGDFYRRHLPHWIPANKTIFLNWRLTAGHFLAEERIASIVAGAILFGHPARYHLHAWVVMPDHVLMILEPEIELASITCWLKGRTARKANRILGRSGKFWQDESFDHWIRSDAEYWMLVRYVHDNPVRAGLVETASDWRWSSAWQGK